MFLSREIDIKLCQIYAKNYIYKILYKNRRFKQIIFSKYNQSKNNDIPGEPEKLRSRSTPKMFRFQTFIFSLQSLGGIPLKHLSDTKRVFNSDENYRLFLNQEMRKSLF